MRLSLLLSPMLALLAATADDEEENGIILRKCCDVYKMLSADGQSCEEAHWPRNFSIERDEEDEYIIVPPLDKKWVRLWLPPGLPIENISLVHAYVNDEHLTSVSSVSATSVWDPAESQTRDLRRDTITLHEDEIVRPKPGGGFRKAHYCVDAAPPPLSPFVVRFRTQCSGEECVFKCCLQGKLQKDYSGNWECMRDEQDHWMTSKSSLAKEFDPEIPYETALWLYCGDWLPSSFDKWNVRRAIDARGVVQFHFSTWKFCFDFYGGSDGSSHEGLFYCEYSHVTKGVFRLLRPLCVLSTLLLLASLLSIACDENMRRKIHGRCLASHAACLFAFNFGQVVYYIAVKDRLVERTEIVPVDLADVCKYFSLWMYFLLTSSWFWLTGHCVNMAMGFRLQVARPNKDRKRFLSLAAFACGLPAMLTITCSYFKVHLVGNDKIGKILWYTPSLAETRTCYHEHIGRKKVSDIPRRYRLYFLKSGTALLYFGPMCCLVMCNVVCLALTLRKVQYLKRGNSVLRREEDQIPVGQSHTEGNNAPKAHTVTGNGQTQGGRYNSGATVDAKTIKLYIKMILMSGCIELLSEAIVWFTTVIEHTTEVYENGLAYRAAGYVTDFFRAVVVTWLAAPEGGYVGLIMRRLRRNRREKKPVRPGNTGRKKRNVA